MGVRPSLVALLSRGDPAMYERMARLTEPAARRALTFCDLHGSVALSRTIPNIACFRLMRDLWSGLDQVVAGELGLLPERGPRHAVGLTEKAFRGALEEPCRMKIGLHWGGGPYVGQPVPGGQLDITAPGDEVNEVARVQDRAAPATPI